MPTCAATLQAPRAGVLQGGTPCCLHINFSPLAIEPLRKELTGLAGELFVAAELLKRGLQTSVTFGNAKGIDLLAFNPETDRSFTVQVKSLRTKNYFPISHDRVYALHAYVFVVLNKPGEPGSVS